MIYLDILDFTVGYSIITSYVYDEISGASAETYGMYMEKIKNGIVVESKRIHDITIDYQKILFLHGLLIKNEVTLCTVSDIIEDWLYELNFEEIPAIDHSCYEDYKEYIYSY